MKKKMMMMADRRKAEEVEDEGGKSVAPVQKPSTTNSVASSITFSNEQVRTEGKINKNRLSVFHYGQT